MNDPSNRPIGDSYSGPVPDERKSLIRLDDFLKSQGLVGTGGEAKVRIQTGEVLVNGDVETRRRRQLRADDIVEIFGEQFPVQADE